MMATTLEQMKQTTLKLRLTVLPGVTVLPRCLQILSRRGLMLVGLTTEELPGGMAVLHLTIVGDVRWHAAIPQLLSRLVDVESVESEQPHA